MTGSAKRKLLIAGGGYSDIPLILSAKKLGFHVITSGNRPGELGHLYSDEYYSADYSDLEGMLTLSKKLNISGICACCNDFSALSSAFVAENMGLPGHDSYNTAKVLHHKNLFRSFTAQNEIPSPIGMGFTSIKEASRFVLASPLPLIVKPVDLTGGKGIAPINNIDQVKSALNRAFAVSPAKGIVVEEFITGSRHGFSAFLHNGRVVFFFSDDEYYYANPYLVSAASTPSCVSPLIEKKLVRESEKIAGLLGLKTGIFHIQYIVKDEELFIIEVCRRAPGDLYIKLVEHATGVKYSDWIVKSSVGMDCDKLNHAEHKGFFTRHCIMTDKPGKVKNIDFDASIEDNMIEKLMWWKKGDDIPDFMTAKFGIVFLRFDTMDEMLTKTENMQKLIRVEVE